MEQRACASGHQCLEKAVCVCVLFPREHHSWGCPCRIRSVGIGYGGGWIPERDQRSGSQILAWPEVCTSYRGTRVCMFMCVCACLCVCVCECPAAATRLELQTHPCNHMNVLASKRTAKSRSMADRQSLGRARDGAMCDPRNDIPIANHQTTLLSWAQEAVAWQSSTDEIVPAPGHKEHSHCLCNSSQDRRSKILEQGWPHKSSPVVEDTTGSSGVLQDCTAHRQPAPTEHPWDTQNLPVSLVECLEVAQLLPGGPCSVPRVWAVVVLQLLPHRTAQL